MSWLSNWANTFKIRFVTYLINKYLGHYLKEKFVLDQLILDVGNGTCLLHDVALDSQTINASLFDALSIPLRMKSCFVKTVFIKIPWKNLLSESIEVSFSKIVATLQISSDSPNNFANKSSQGSKTLIESLNSIVNCDFNCVEADISEFISEQTFMEELEKVQDSVDDSNKEIFTTYLQENPKKEIYFKSTKLDDKRRLISMSEIVFAFIEETFSDFESYSLNLLYQHINADKSLSNSFLPCVPFFYAPSKHAVIVTPSSDLLPNHMVSILLQMQKVFVILDVDIMRYLLNLVSTCLNISKNDGEVASSQVYLSEPTNLQSLPLSFDLSISISSIFFAFPQLSNLSYNDKIHSNEKASSYVDCDRLEKNFKSILYVNYFKAFALLVSSFSFIDDATFSNNLLQFNFESAELFSILTHPIFREKSLIFIFVDNFDSNFKHSSSFSFNIDLRFSQIFFALLRSQKSGFVLLDFILTLTSSYKSSTFEFCAYQNFQKFNFNLHFGDLLLSLSPINFFTCVDFLLELSSVFDDASRKESFSSTSYPFSSGVFVLCINFSKISFYLSNTFGETLLPSNLDFLITLHNFISKTTFTQHPTTNSSFSFKSLSLSFTSVLLDLCNVVKDPTDENKVIFLKDMSPPLINIASTHKDFEKKKSDHIEYVLIVQKMEPNISTSCQEGSLYFSCLNSFATQNNTHCQSYHSSFIHSNQSVMDEDDDVLNNLVDLEKDTVFFPFSLKKVLIGSESSEIILPLSKDQLHSQVKNFVSLNSSSSNTEVLFEIKNIKSISLTSSLDYNLKYIVTQILSWSDTIRTPFSFLKKHNSSNSNADDVLLPNLKFVISLNELTFHFHLSSEHNKDSAYIDATNSEALLEAILLSTNDLLLVASIIFSNDYSFHMIRFSLNFSSLFLKNIISSKVLTILAPAQCKEITTNKYQLSIAFCCDVLQASPPIIELTISISTSAFAVSSLLHLCSSMQMIIYCLSLLWHSPNEDDHDFPSTLNNSLISESFIVNFFFQCEQVFIYFLNEKHFFPKNHFPKKTNKAEEDDCGKTQRAQQNMDFLLQVGSVIVRSTFYENLQVKDLRFFVQDSVIKACSSSLLPSYIVFLLSNDTTTHSKFPFSTASLFQTLLMDLGVLEVDAIFGKETEFLNLISLIVKNDCLNAHFTPHLLATFVAFLSDLEKYFNDLFSFRSQKSSEYNLMLKEENKAMKGKHVLNECCVVNLLNPKVGEKKSEENLMLDAILENSVSLQKSKKTSHSIKNNSEKIFPEFFDSGFVVFNFNAKSLNKSNIILNPDAVPIKILPSYFLNMGSDEPDKSFFPPQNKIIQTLDFEDLSLKIHLYSSPKLEDDIFMFNYLNPIISVVLNKICIKVQLFGAGSPYFLKVSSSLHKLEILDLMPSSSFNKMLCALISTSFPFDSNSKMLIASFILFHISDDSCLKEAAIKFKVHPISLSLNQNILTFLHSFFLNFLFHLPPLVFADSESNIEVSKNNENADNSGQFFCSLLNHLFFKEFILSSDTLIKISYRGKGLSNENLLSSTTPLNSISSTLIALAKLNNCSITLRRISTKQGFLGLKRLITFITNIWIEDIKENQLQNVIQGLEPMQSLTNLTKGIYDLFVLPITEYQQKQRLMTGIKKGVTSFTSISLFSLLHLSCKCVFLLNQVAESTLVLISPPQALNQSQIHILPSSTPTAPNHEDFRSFLLRAYTSLSHGFSQTSDDLQNIVHWQREEFQKTLKQVPTSLLRPMVYTTETTHYLLQALISGVTRKETKQNIKNKWK